MMKSSSLRVLVVGGAGYIGSHVTKALLKNGHRPIVFDNLKSGLRQNLFADIPFIHGDILIPDQINQAAAGDIDAIIHLAALKAAGESMVKPELYAIHNISGSINLINAATQANVRNLVFSSSAAVYGNPQYLPLDEQHPTEPINFYGYTKLEIERIIEWYSQLKPLHFANLRYFNAAGYDIEGEICGLEQNPSNLFPVILETIVGMRDSLEVFGDDYDTPDGSCIRDYIHLTDLANAHVSALEYIENKKENLTLNLGTSNGTSVFEAVGAAKKISGVDFEVKIAPRRPGDPAKLTAIVDKADTCLGWRAKHSDPETIIRTMLEAYQFKR